VAKYRVLSIDGGGIRGLITTVMMQRLAATPGLENFLDKVDLIAGTSTGAMSSGSNR
jgi:patatin-like phospholipase/acyl hydrolase